jgi:hypothetical protein
VDAIVKLNKTAFTKTSSGCLFQFGLPCFYETIATQERETGDDIDETSCGCKVAEAWHPFVPESKHGILGREETLILRTRKFERAIKLGTDGIIPIGMALGTFVVSKLSRYFPRKSGRNLLSDLAAPSYYHHRNATRHARHFTPTRNIV